jgi:hypothetical protein
MSEQITVKRALEYMREWMNLTGVKHLPKYKTDHYLFFLGTQPQTGNEHEYRIERNMNVVTSDWNVQIHDGVGYDWVDAIPKQEE